MPMKVVRDSPPTTAWVPQTEPLDLGEELGWQEDENGNQVEIYLECLDPAVQHRIESWLEAVALLRRWVKAETYPEATEDIPDIYNDSFAFLAANAPEES